MGLGPLYAWVNSAQPIGPRIGVSSLPEDRGRRFALPPRGEVEALYVHIPFCFHKCHYCDFYSITRQAPERMERFVELILREAELWADRNHRDKFILLRQSSNSGADDGHSSAGSTPRR